MQLPGRFNKKKYFSDVRAFPYQVGHQAFRETRVPEKVTIDEHGPVPDPDREGPGTAALSYGCRPGPGMH
jgi:hypothetical protein